MSYDSFSNTAFLDGVFSGTFGKPMTLVCWVKRDGTGWSSTTQRLFFSLGQDDIDSFHTIVMTVGIAADRILATSWDATSSGGAQYDFTTDAYDDTWVCVIGSFVATGDTDVYIENFDNFSHSTNSKDVGTTLDTVVIGMKIDSGNSFDGLIAECAIFDRELTESEINALQTGPEAGPPPNSVASADCVAYWSLDSDQTTHADESGNGGPSISENGTVAFNADHPTISAGGPVEITDVNTTETWNDGDTGLVITGTGFV